MPAREGDRAERLLAVRIGEVFPRWCIMWGAYSREYWAYPQFRVPRGTIAHAADPGDLTAQIRAVEAAVTGNGR